MGTAGAGMAATPEPPYVAVIFTSLRTDGDHGYEATATAMAELAAAQPGYLGVESARDPGGLGITVSYWSDESAARGWKHVAGHLLAQRTGRETWYREYLVRVATVSRDYGFAPRAEDANANANARTIDSYRRHVREYIDGTPGEVTGTVREWLDRAVVGVPLDARVLEFGSASGRDAAYLENFGYAVDRTDATPEFVARLRSTGLPARVLNAVTDELPPDADLVLANAVLLHLTREQAASVLRKVHACLRPRGKFAFTLKEGEGEEWTTAKLGAPRFFCYWTQPGIIAAATAAGFADVTVWAAAHRAGGAGWLQVIARKA